MTVVYDATTEQHRSTSAAVTTFTHVAGAGVQGVAVAFVRAGTDVAITLVSYGGTPLVKINKAVDTTNEPGSAEWWYAPHTTAGSQTVSYSPGTRGSNIHAVAVTFTADAPPYAISNQIEQENTTSASVSLTTGYVQGVALGAFYGGGADPLSFTYATTISLLHDWDMGAFYSEVFRLTTATTAGTGPILDFGGIAQAGTDDVAMAAIFLTDGVIKPAVGLVTAGLAGGLVPGLEKTFPPLDLPVAVGLVTAGLGGGLVPVVTGVVFPGIGAIVGQSTITGPVISYTPAPLNTHEPTLYTELKQGVGVGLAVTVGQIPDYAAPPVEATALPGVGLVATVGQIPDEYRELKQDIGVGAVAAAGQIPDEYRELNQGIGVGLVATGGLVPEVLGDNTIGPQVGLATAAGQVPGLFTELTQETGVGLAIMQGLVPVVDTGAVAVEATAEPGVGLVTMGGLEPTLAVEYDKPRGHVTTKKRRRGRSTPVYDQTLSATAVVKLPPELTPAVAAYWDPPAVAIAGIDTAALATIDGQLTALEAAEQLRRKRRREEEELITLWLRAA